MSRYVKLTWRGRQLEERVNQATIRGMSETLQSAVTLAKSFAPVDTGALRADISYEEPHISGSRIVARWGNFTVTYALWQELGWSGHPGRFYLRSAADIEYPRMKERIRRHM